MIKISDAHWDRIRHHFPEEGIPDDRPGRKPVPARRVLDAVLWILTTGAQWHLLPQSYPNYKTVHRRFQAWARQDILRGILVDLANELRERDLLDTTECYIDATFANGRGGGLEIGNTKCGKGVKIMAIVDRAGLPLSVSTHAAAIAPTTATAWMTTCGTKASSWSRRTAGIGRRRRPRMAAN